MEDQGALKFTYVVTSPPHERTSDNSVTTSSSEDEEEEEEDEAEADGVLKTRSRIRRRVSEAPALEGEAEASLVGEEERLMTIDYDDVVTAEEVEEIKRTVWKPQGTFPSLESLSKRLDYRKAWEIGRTGTKLMQRISGKDTLAFRSEAGFFCDAEFDGTDYVGFLRVRKAPETRRSVRQSILESVRTESPTSPVYIFPAETLFRAHFYRVVGTMQVSDTTQISPPMKEANVTFDLIKGAFMDAMIFCLWQIKVQLEIRKIRMQRISNVIHLQEASTERRRDLSRARAALARASSITAGTESPNSATNSNLLYDPAPQRARLSSALVAPQMTRPRKQVTQNE